MVGMNLRYRPDAMLLRSLIRNNEIGVPLICKMRMVQIAKQQGLNGLRVKKTSGGGVIIDLGIFAARSIIWL